MGFSFIETSQAGQCGLLLGSLERQDYKLHEVTAESTVVHSLRPPPTYCFAFLVVPWAPLLNFIFPLPHVGLKNERETQREKNESGNDQDQKYDQLFK